MKTEKLYLICDFKSWETAGDTPYSECLSTWCRGRIVHQDGSLLGEHTSTNLWWLEQDLCKKVDNIEMYEIINLFDKEIPSQFKLK